ncbi:MAG TPA: hypothetical protein VJX69_13375 [Terriglobales bacterium]|nr:hypothetical protein [Terriglobales bacterium]
MTITGRVIGRGAVMWVTVGKATPGAIVAKGQVQNSATPLAKLLGKKKVS